MEEQNLNALIHLKSLSAPMTEMLAKINDAELRVRNEIQEIGTVCQRLEVVTRLIIFYINSQTCHSLHIESSIIKFGVSQLIQTFVIIYFDVMNYFFFLKESSNYVCRLLANFSL